MATRRLSDWLGWAWVVTMLVATPWLGQGGSPCPPEGPSSGAACIMVLISRDWSLGLLAALAAAALWVSKDGQHLASSGLTLLTVGVLAGAWAATHRFLGSAYHAPRLPVVLVCSIPPLLLGGQRLLAVRRRTDITLARG